MLISTSTPAALTMRQPAAVAAGSPGASSAVATPEVPNKRAAEPTAAPSPDVRAECASCLACSQRSRASDCEDSTLEPIVRICCHGSHRS